MSLTVPSVSETVLGGRGDSCPQKQLDQPDADSWKNTGSNTRAKRGHFPESAGNTVTMELATANDEQPEMPRFETPFVHSRLSLALTVNSKRGEIRSR